MSFSKRPDDVMDGTGDREVATILRSLAPEEVDMLRDTFIYMDRDSDGFVSREEMMAKVASCVGAERFPPLQEYLVPLFQVADKDRDERLSLTEFLMAFADGPGVVPAEVVNSCVADVQVRLTDEEVSALQSNFNRIDTNQDGVIDSEELEVALRTYLVPTFPDLTDENFKEIVSVVMASADADQNGVISLSEFIRSYQEDQGVLPATYLEPTQKSLAGARQLTDDEETVLREAFAVLDRNNDGFVDLEDLYHALSDALGSATEDESQIRDLCNLVMRSSDRSKSGQLTVTDFVRSFLRNIQLMQIPVAVAHERVRVACEKLQQMQDSGELERLVKVFEDLDSDGDGFVVRSELVKVLKVLFHDAFPGWDEEMLTSIMTAIVVGAERNNGGRLSLEEFIRSFVEGSGVLPPEAVKKWDSAPRRGSYSTEDALKQSCYRSSTATDADLGLIGEALSRLYAEKGADGVITEDELHSGIAELYVDDPNRGEEMFHFALQQFVLPRKNGGLMWSANVLFEDEVEEDDRGVRASRLNPSDSAVMRSSTSPSRRPRASVLISANEVVEPTSSAPSRTAWMSSTQSPRHQILPHAADATVHAAVPRSQSSSDKALSCTHTQPKLIDEAATTPAASVMHSWGEKRPLSVNELCSFRPDSTILTEKLKQQFEYYDVEHRGYLDRDTFKKIYATMENYGLDPSPMEVDRRFRRYSRMSDKIFFNEFCILMLQRARL
ncbi:calmodulin-related protein, putative [Leishmania donovani]|uniref:Calmodulin-related protein, putative n=2 Tax=Leishmania donovani TaxID=5661 RepID=E9BM84_LEIDO|nr:calmodulin-related protein, putative [Leishmania donovani]AYU81141.1 calmodulin-related protein, putative [Leishmania donovani]CBZ36362.1 calmodulin-related protein, putative [Leishmania donovani]